MTMLSYDEVYSQPGYYWGKDPNGMCNTAVNFWSPEERLGKKVIDLGCGEGRDIIHFARHGFDATGVDISQPGLDKAQRWAAEEGLSIKTIRASLQEFRLSDMYDVVYSSGTLTYVPPHLRAEVFENYKRFTRAGGINVFNVFVEKPYIPTPHDWGADEYFFRSGELLAYYWDWEIISFTEFEFDCHSGGQPHRHAINVMVARKVIP
jgi:tellurite methyltransferase